MAGPTNIIPGAGAALYAVDANDTRAMAARKRKLAEALGEDAISGKYGAAGWASVASALAKGLTAGYLGNKADETDSAINKRLSEALASGDDSFAQAAFGVGDLSSGDYLDYRGNVSQRNRQAQMDEETLRHNKVTEALAERNQSLDETTAAQKPPPVSPYERTAQQESAKLQSAATARVQAAKSLLGKLERTLPLIGQADPKTGAFISGDDAMFGPVQGSGLNRFGGSLLGTDTEKKRQLLEGKLSDLVGDVAVMKYKGQGSVSDYERKAAALILPTLQAADARTAYDQLRQQAEEAKAIIANGGLEPGELPPLNKPASIGSPQPAPGVSRETAPTQGGGQFDALLGKAKAAIASGKDPAAIKDRLIKMGVPPELIGTINSGM